MKKTILALTAALAFSGFALAEDGQLVTLTTGKKDGTYHNVFGANFAAALREFGYKTTLTPSKGSLDNLDRVAANEAQIGFVQADAFMLWHSKHQNEAAHVGTIGKLQKECAYLVVKDGGKIDDEDDIKAGVKLAIGKPDSGTYATWQYMRQLEKDYAAATTTADDSNLVFNSIKTGDIDGFLIVNAQNKTNARLTAAAADGSGLKIIGLDDYSLDGKLPTGERVYSLEKSAYSQGWGNNVKTSCMDTLVIGNIDEANEQLVDDAAGIVMTNLNRIISAK